MTERQMMSSLIFMTIPMALLVTHSLSLLWSSLHSYMTWITMVGQASHVKFGVGVAMLFALQIVLSSYSEGVPNAQLAKEKPEMAALYRDKSIAEQNSVDLAWDLLSDPRYKDLRDCIAADEEERKRFRQLVVNSVMATDIFDKDMKNLRNSRWDKAFHCCSSGEQELANSNMEENRNRKATIVIEHIIQASDVAHTMQHWHIYTKWNERLFGNYVIPLAKKLEECNVFGVTSDECLNYATANRNEWEAKGEEIVAQMVARYQKQKFFRAGRAKTKAPSRNDIVKSKKRSL